jgi:D-serine deaminase-like pyridoxal phosphate-dependent protein
VFDDVLGTPFAYVDTDTLAANIQAMSGAAARSGLALRPHAKTHKLAAVARLQLDAGAVGLTVAKVGEAEALVQAGVMTSYLIAHPFWSRQQVDRFVALQRRCEVVASVDSIDGAQRLSAAGQRAGVDVAVSLIVDTGYGRFGVTPETARETAVAIARMPAVKLVGTRSHAGHVYAQRDREARRTICLEEVSTMTSVAEQIRGEGLALPNVSVGSTPGAAPFLELDDIGAVTEFRPGNYVFLDRQQCSMGVASVNQCALTIVTTVISTPRHDIAILDAGKLTLSSTPDPLAAGYGLVVQCPNAIVSSLSQECATVKTYDWRPPIGTRVSVVPNHACEITNLASEVYYGAGGRIAGVWRPEAARCSN